MAEPADASIPHAARTNAGAEAGAGLHPQIPALVEAAVADSAAPADSDSGVPALRARTRVDQNDLHLLNAVIDDGRPATADADMDAGADVAPLRSVVRAQADAQLTAVPTLSQWGLATLTLAMAAAGLLRTRKSTTDRRH